MASITEPTIAVAITTSSERRVEEPAAERTENRVTGEVHVINLRAGKFSK